MARQITASTPRTRLAPRLGVLEVAVIAVISAAVIGVVWSQAGSARDVTVDSQAYGVGYPLHGGLAGPSRVGQMPTVGGPRHPMTDRDLAGHHGQDYPLHGGLAGPSRVVSPVDAGGYYGPGYPLNGGLAGPSRADDGE